jgi:DNA-binding CsgD family transcriptional regulator
MKFGHLQSCYRKLGCDNILGLALWAIKNGCDWRSLENAA